MMIVAALIYRHGIIQTQISGRILALERCSSPSNLIILNRHLRVTLSVRIAAYLSFSLSFAPNVK